MKLDPIKTSLFPEDMLPASCLPGELKSKKEDCENESNHNPS